MILRALFIDGQCLIAPGYTTFAIEALKKIKINVLVDGGKVIGGAIEPAALTRAMTRMASWVVMASQTIEVEFPGFELRACFRVFVLLQTQSQGNSDSVKIPLRTLAQAFDLGPCAVEREYFDLLPIAIHKKFGGSQEVTMFEAWRLALEAVRQRKCTREAHPSSNIGQILMRYCAWGSSTAEVERNFSMTQSIKGGSSEDFAIHHELDTMTIRSDCTKVADHSEFVQEASKVALDCDTLSVW